VEWGRKQPCDDIARLYHLRAQMEVRAGAPPILCRVTSIDCSEQAKSAPTRKKKAKLEYEYDGVILPEDADARRKLRNKLSAKVHRKRKQDSLDKVKKLVEEYDDTIKDLKAQLTGLGNPLATEIFDSEEDFGTKEEGFADPNPCDHCDLTNGIDGQNIESTCSGIKPEKPGEENVASPAFDSNGKRIRRPRTVAPVINGQALPTAPDEESRKLRRLMRNRVHARRSRERKKKEAEALNAQRRRKESQISKMRSILELAKGKSADVR